MDGAPHQFPLDHLCHHLGQDAGAAGTTAAIVSKNEATFCLYEIRLFNSLSFTYLRIHVPDAPGRRAGRHQSGAQSQRLSGDSLVVLTSLIPLRMIRHQSIVYKTNHVSTRSANDVVTIDGAEFNARQISPIRTVQTFFHWL